ncbi:hypothetical protein DL240_09850 [Lujinxingia litoralis]|uniref:Type II secretion system protein GspF domain-containing protein n=1 Tax=Lujinxingia litoralis TaxID=2211119 RepID=A0A328C4G2_9DELT|nr:type II secretion system F family protein [Lujinxingia litoralis]RAL22149.1 hypothetical protein DL240_09850 [Lujinxingia litoralis]
MASPYSAPYEREPVVRESSTYLTDAEAASLCTIFFEGLESGMSYARIIDMMDRQGFESKMVRRLRHSLMERGDMLGEAFARYGLLDSTARKLVLVAEEQGKLPRTFRHLANHYGKRHRRRKKLLISFAEPVLLIVLGVFIALTLFTADLTEIAMRHDTWTALGEVLMGGVLQGAIFLLLVGFGAMVFLNLPVDLSVRGLGYRLWLAVPLLNRASLYNTYSIFCRYTEQSISSGLTVHKALELAAEASNNSDIERKIHIAQRVIEEGGSLAKGLYQMKVLPDDILENVDVGEETGRLQERLSSLAERYEERADETFENLMNGFVYVSRMAIAASVIIALLLTLVSQFQNDFLL